MSKKEMQNIDKKSEIIMFSVCPTRFGVFGQSLHIAQSIAFYANKGECLSAFAYVTYLYADYFGWKIYLKIFEILLDLCLIVCVWIKNRLFFKFNEFF